MNTKNDVFGNAIADYFAEPNSAKITVHSPDFEDDEIPVSYLFRSFSEMPKIEQKALQLCQGKTLDVGCGAGSHSVYLQKQKLNVTAIDTSPKAIETCKQRGIKNAEVIDFFELPATPFDTLLFLMNGIGIVGKLENIHSFFDQVKLLLKPDGQVLLDSSDLMYLYEDADEDIKDSPIYYGEMEYQTSYLKYTSGSFNWLYIDFDSLSFLADLHGFKAEKIMDGSHYDYLARLTFNID